MATTTYGTPYVQSSDLVSAYPGTSSTLATRVDDISLKGNGINAQTASYTLVLADGGKTITMTNAGATTLTVPTNASVAFPTGVGIVALNLGAGTMTVAGASGVTVNGSSLAVLQYESITLRKTDTNTWLAVKGGGLPKASVTATTGSPTVTTVSGKTCYKFTGSGSITIGNAGVCEVLVVGGGGSGGNGAPGGGGAGGYLNKSVYFDSGTQTIQVGGGGAGASANSNGNQGTGSAVGHVYVPGGGGGGWGSVTGTPGTTGGSGGGGGQASTVGSQPLIAALGTAGGGYNGGGGGAGQAGANGYGAGGTQTGKGGDGLSSSIDGTATVRAGGGGGYARVSGGGAISASGGSGGGGATGVAGTVNTGGGSGADGGTAGGSGIVILLVG